MVISGNHLFQLSERTPGGVISPWCKRTEVGGRTYGQSFAGYDVRIKQGVFLGSGEFSLASTIEHFQIPLSMVAMVYDKSSWARKGISLFNTIFEPGWRGYATLEIANLSADTIQIRAGDPIAQVVFQKLSEPLTAGYEGKYQDQEDRPVEAR